ncbi:sacsin N-terminal ATP-binding-like domain-containing protein [Embleya sp. NPDC059237]|uniref:sacsin N-terminal ATP-binding-like domain-containing protein n=1 Tax=Embleya sp. NPDC059237 TaxID=3346784 RepID=UPI003693B3C8
MGIDDRFGTASLRRAVLDAWGASPARFREDANAEEELALGGYRDRLVVELAQNAADAAARAGMVGRLRLTLRDGVLVAANTGDPLHAPGVEALSTLRASAKRDDGPEAVGRFGVGFAAVLAVTDEPCVLSRTGGVRWSLHEARDLVAEQARDNAGLADELARRDGGVPVLRLPMPAEGTPPEDYDTCVVLPLRDGAAVDLAARLLAEVDDALLLTLRRLGEIVIETPEGVRTLTCRADGGALVVTDNGVQTRWRVAEDGGALEPALLADRPTEERRRAAWSVLWAVPLDAADHPRRPSVRPVVHAPTPTDEPLGLPALLVASFPLDPTRRHTAPGPLRDFLIERAAETYAGLLGTWPVTTTAVLSLVPGPTGEGELDGLLRRAVLDRLAETAFLPAAAPGAGFSGAFDTAASAAGSVVEAEPDDRDALLLDRGTAARDRDLLRPRDAVLIETAGPRLVEALAPVVAGLLPAGLDRSAALRVLGVRRLPLAEVVDQLAGMEREPSWWRDLYDAFDPAARDALGALPVPLADGRIVRGPRGVLLPCPESPDPAVLDVLRLRVAHPDATHPLLERLGAVRATPRAVLADPAVRAAVGEGEEGDDIADAVLELVRAARIAAGDEPWLAALLLPDVDGDAVPAGELMLPGSRIAAVVEPDALGVAHPDLVERWGEDVLEAVGVLGTFGLVREEDVVLDHDGCDHDLDAEDDWLDDVLDHLPDQGVPPVLAGFAAVRDLDLVADDAWDEALEVLATPPLRNAVTEPAHVLLPDGGRARVPSYTSWWLRGHPVLDGRRPAGLLALDGDRLLHGLYDRVRASLDPVFLTALGVRTTLPALLADPDGPDELLERLADPDRAVTRDQLRALYTALAEVTPERLSAPTELRGVCGGRMTVADVADALVGDAPDLAALVADDATHVVLPVRPDRAEALADLLDVPLLSETIPGKVLSEGTVHEVPDDVLVAMPDAPKEYVEHEELIVSGPDGTELEADWRYIDGKVHATTFEGVARGLAWAAGEWHRRFEVEQLLTHPENAAHFATERDFDGV